MNPSLSVALVTFKYKNTVEREMCTIRTHYRSAWVWLKNTYSSLFFSVAERYYFALCDFKKKRLEDDCTSRMHLRKGKRKLVTFLVYIFFLYFSFFFFCDTYLFFKK